MDYYTACKLANVKPTKRQESKFDNKKGIAYKVAVLKTAEQLEEGMPGYDTDFLE